MAQDFEIKVFVKADLGSTNDRLSTYEWTQREIDRLPSPVRTWQEGSPAQNGWYNASAMQSSAVFRYWDAKRKNWSDEISPRRWGEPDAWREVRSKPSGMKPSDIYWRRISPYRDGPEWDFLRG